MAPGEYSLTMQIYIYIGYTYTNLHIYDVQLIMDKLRDCGLSVYERLICPACPVRFVVLAGLHVLPGRGSWHALPINCIKSLSLSGICVNQITKL